MTSINVRTQETRALGKNHQRSCGRNSPGWNEIFESSTWLDSKEFKEYALEVALILESANEPLCTREIHNALGSKARPRWTMDALEAVRNLGKTGVLVTRYFIIAGDMAQPQKLDQDAEHDRIFEN
jgi:hypothetical protein